MSENVKRKSNKKVSKEKEICVDVKNDAQMVALGIRNPSLSPRDKNVWIKTSDEKRILRKFKHSCKEDSRCSSIPTKSIPVWDKLIIYLEKNNVFPKTTYSIECWQHDIKQIISNYCIPDKKSKDKNAYKNIVKKYSYNGKTYSNNELPFWGF